MLEQACRTVDLIDRLTGEITEAPSIVPGSRGQDVVNPLIVEVRLQREELNRLLRALELPDDEEPKGRRGRDRMGRFRSPAQGGKVVDIDRQRFGGR